MVNLPNRAQDSVGGGGRNFCHGGGVLAAADQRRHGFCPAGRMRLYDTYVGQDLPVRPEEVCPVDEGVLRDEPNREEVVQEYDEVERVQYPKLPTPQEVYEHNLTHLPYRSWCCHCVRGKGKLMEEGAPRENCERTPRGLLLHWMQGRSGDAVHCGGAKDFDSKKCDVQCGTTERSLSRVSGGWKSIPAKTFYDVWLVGSSASNSVAERGVQTVEGQIRVVKDALETRFGDRGEQPQHFGMGGGVRQDAGQQVRRWS